MNQNLWNVAKSNAQKETYNFKLQYKKREKGFKPMIPASALRNEEKKEMRNRRANKTYVSRRKEIIKIRVKNQRTDSLMTKNGSLRR